MIVGLRLEGRVGERVLRTNGGAEIGGSIASKEGKIAGFIGLFLRKIVGCGMNVGLNVEKFTNLQRYFPVEVI